MGKRHRDNYKARKKRGSTAFDKKKKRRAATVLRICQRCNGKMRTKDPLPEGLCDVCRKESQ